MSGPFVDLKSQFSRCVFAKQSRWALLRAQAHSIFQILSFSVISLSLTALIGCGQDSDLSGQLGSEGNPIVSFSSPTSSVNESEVVLSVSVHISEEPNENQTVDYFLNVASTATAGAGADFEFASGTLTFPAGSSAAQQLVVTIHDDSYYDDGELIGIALSNPSADVGLGATSEHVIEIIDDEPQPTVDFVITSSSLAESETTHNVAVRISGEAEKPVSVNYIAAGASTATSGAANDFELGSGTVTFPVHSTANQNIAVTIHGDSAEEADEVIALALTTPVVAAIGGNSSHAITIIDNDDITPAAFGFTDQTGVATSTLTLSNIVQITDVDQAVDISVTGGEYRVCADATCSSAPAFTSVAGTGSVDNNDYVQVRLTSSASNSTLSQLTLNVGSGSDTWDVTTADDAIPVAFNFTDQSDVALGTQILSDIVQITGISVGVDVSVVGGEYRVCSSSDCSAVVQAWGSSAGTGVVNNNNYVQLRLTSSASNSTLSQATLTVGGVSDTWDVTTIGDSTPVAFNFTDQTDVAVSSQILSNIVQITGIDVGTDISVAGGEYRVCSAVDCSVVVQTWGSSAGTGVVNNNHYVQIRLNSSAANSTLSQATLSVGGVSDTWDVTTVGDSTPVAFNFSDQTDVALSTQTVSDIVQVTGIDIAVDISVTGGEYRVCSAVDCSTEIQTWGPTAGTGVVGNNDYVQVRLNSSGANSTLAQAALTVGGTSDTWDVTTLGDAIPDAFGFTDQAGVAVSTQILSDIVQITGLGVAVDISVTGGEYRVCSAVDCSTEVQTWGSVAGTGVVSNNHYVQLRLTSSAANDTLSQASLTVGGVSDTWDVTTVGDTTPVAFNFTDEADVAVSTVISSNILQITGITMGVDISVIGGEYRVCDSSDCSSEVQTWGSTAGTGIVDNNDYVQIRLTSNAANSTLSQTTLTVGGTSDTWGVTTIGDSTPVAFSFTDQTDVALSTQILSNIVQITGIDIAVDIGVTGDVSAEYRICSANDCSAEIQTWGLVDGIGAVDNNDYVQLRLTSSAANSILSQATLTVGGTSNAWDVITLHDIAPAAFNFTDQTGVAVSTVTPSNIIQVTGISTGVDISVTGGEYRVCDSSDCSSEVQTWGSTAGTGIVDNNDYVQLRLTSSAASSTLSQATLTVGGGSDTWDVTTAHDIAPAAFNFSDQTGVALSTLANSDIVQITGISTGVDISVTGGEYRVCSANDCSLEVQTWGSTAGTGVVNNNHYVQVRLTSSASNATLSQATLSVGSGSGTWDVTTLGDAIPNAFSFTAQTDVSLSSVIESNIVQITGLAVGADISISGGTSPEYRICAMLLVLELLLLQALQEQVHLITMTMFK